MKSKQNKGITLIALAVTIIVMLILAGVSISMLTGESGIITRAKNAKAQSELAEEQEKVKLSISAALTEDLATENGITDETLRKNIIENFGSDENLEGVGPWIYKGKNNTYKITDEGTIEEKAEAVKGTLAYMFEQGKDCTVENCTNSEHLHIGDYVNLQNPTTGSIIISGEDAGYGAGGPEQTYKIANNQLNWRVLGQNELGEVELIAASPMKSENQVNGREFPYLFLYGIDAYLNGENILNNICKLYKTNDKTGYISSARSVNQNDIDKAVGLTTTADVKNVNINAYDGYANIGTVHKFDWHWDNNELLPNKVANQKKGKVTGYSYSINSRIDDNAPFVSVSDRVYNMLFDNTEYGSGKSYWVATKGLVEDYDGVIFGLNMVDYFYDEEDGVGCTWAGTTDLYYSRGYENQDLAAVRPVISLKASVTSEQVEKVSDKTETNWDYSYSVSVEG